MPPEIIFRSRPVFRLVSVLRAIYDRFCKMSHFPSADEVGHPKSLTGESLGGGDARRSGRRSTRAGQAEASTEDRVIAQVMKSADRLRRHFETLAPVLGRSCEELIDSSAEAILERLKGYRRDLSVAVSN